MPNWIFSTATFSGTEEAVHKLIKIGLEHSGLPSTGDLRQDFNLLVAEGKSPELDEEAQRVVMTKGLTARTFLPIPETYILYDTTNHPNRYPDAAKEQQEKYGAVGWYDYNCLTLGTKWDFELTNVELEERDNRWLFYTDIETAWDYPAQWFVAMKGLVSELKVDFIVDNYYDPPEDDDDPFEACRLYGYVDDGEIKEGRRFEEL